MHAPRAHETMLLDKTRSDEDTDETERLARLARLAQASSRLNEETRLDET
jgi:hypothetical protein